MMTKKSCCHFVLTHVIIFVENLALRREWRTNHNLWAAQTSRALPQIHAWARWILWSEAACCSPLPAVEGFPSVVLPWDVHKEAEGVGFKRGMFNLWAAAAWDACDPPATGVLLKTDLKIHRAHIQPICYRCEIWEQFCCCLISMKHWQLALA